MKTSRSLFMKALGRLFSPTWALIDWWKKKDIDEGRGRLLKWHWSWFIGTLIFCSLLYMIDIKMPAWIAGGLGYLAFSRWNEIVYAFYKDALEADPE
jgi:drug/metabolite transporter (DMT)-like permease